MPEVGRLIAEERYFSLHAPRQTGRTTVVRALAEDVRARGTVALHASLETSRQTPEVRDAEPRWLRAITESAEVDLDPPDRPPSPEALDAGEGSRLGQLLRRWAAALHPRPLVLLLDEVDTLEGPALVNLLAQLRGGFHHRPHGFPAAVGLVGTRDLRDDRVAAGTGRAPTPGSPFNIKAESLTLASFTPDEVAELYAQHASDTGQPFTDDAIERAWHWSAGQPFLVNALAYHPTRRVPIPPPDPHQRARHRRGQGAPRPLPRDPPGQPGGAAGRAAGREGRPTGPPG